MTKLANILTKDFLEKELKTKFVRQIAKEQKCTTRSIYNYIQKYNVVRITKGEKNANKLKGHRFERLVVIEYGGVDKFQKILLKCLCDCGKTVIVNHASLKRNLTTSCGCYKMEKCRKKGYKEISYTYYKKMRDGALSRFLEFEISLEDIWDQYILQNRTCALSGVSIIFHPDRNKQKLQTASVDRIESSLGYTKENIQIVHKRVNIMKGNMTNNELKFWIYHMFHELKPNGDFNDQHRDLLRIYRT